jgi:hypothetical protein
VKRLLILAAALVAVWGTAAAQADDDRLPNDPHVNEDANACFAGGSLEGECAPDGDGNGVVDDYEHDWAWNCGWHLIRLQAKMIVENDMPVWCMGLIYTPVCYPTLPELSLSFQYIGPPNTPGNMLIYRTDNCTDTAVQPQSALLIYADTEADATAVCEALAPSIYDLVSLAGLGIGTSWPDNLYLCDFGELVMFTTP